MQQIPNILLELLRSIDTPTVCNAIEMVQGKRGFSQFTRQTVKIADPQLPPIVGFAKTAKIRASAPPKENVDIVNQRREAYYEYVAKNAQPALCVIEDLDFPNCIGAFWGEINSWIHKGFGIDGVITNGVMRDLGDLAPRFQIIAGSILPSHAFVHVVEFDTEVNVFGLPVKPNDFIHADQHGAVVIPEDIIPELEWGIPKLINAEKIILDGAKSNDFNLKKFKTAWSEFGKAKV